MYKIGDLTLPELEELLRKKKDSLLINPLPETPDMTGVPTATPAPVPLPRVPVSARAATELSPEQIAQIQAESPEEKSGNLLQTLAAIAMIFNPLAGATMMGMGKKKERGALATKAATVAQAEESEKLRTERGFKEQELGIQGRHAGASERQAGASERQAGAAERRVGIEEMLAPAEIEHKKGMLDVARGQLEVDRERNDIMRANASIDKAAKEAALRKELLENDKFDYDRAKQEVENRIKTAREQTMLGTVGRIPVLLLESWEADAFERTGNPRLMKNLPQMRSRNLRKFIDTKLAAGIQPMSDPKKAGLSIESSLRELLKSRKITATEYRAAVDYIKTPLDVLKASWTQ